MNGSFTLPTGRRGQAIAAAGLFALVIAAWFGLVAPLADWYAERGAAIDQKRVLLAHLSALALRLPALERQLATSADGKTAEIEGATDARAGADLQQQIEGMTEAAGAHLASTEFLQPEQADGYRRIQLRVSLSTRWPVLISLMAAIETASRPLLVDDFHVRAIGSEGDPTPAAEATFVVIMLRATPVRQTAPPLAPS
jgi:general secretion pathway protein M